LGEVASDDKIGAALLTAKPWEVPNNSPF
jgi:hypothetical protein